MNDEVISGALHYIEEECFRLHPGFKKHGKMTFSVEERGIVKIFIDGSVHLTILSDDILEINDQAIIYYKNGEMQYLVNGVNHTWQSLSNKIDDEQRKEKAR